MRLAPTLPLAARRRCCGILRRDECVALVTKPRAFLGLCTHLKQLVRGFLDAPAALRGHQAPEKIRHATILSIAFLGARRTRNTALIVRPLALAFGLGAFSWCLEREHGGGGFWWCEKAKGIEFGRGRDVAGSGRHDGHQGGVRLVLALVVDRAGNAGGSGCALVGVASFPESPRKAGGRSHDRDPGLMTAWARLQRKEGGRAHVLQCLRVKVVELDELRRGAVRPDDDVVLAFRGRLQEVGPRVLELTQGLRRPEPPLLAVDVDVSEVKSAAPSLPTVFRRGPSRMRDRP